MERAPQPQMEFIVIGGGGAQDFFQGDRINFAQVLQWLGHDVPERLFGWRDSKTLAPEEVEEDKQYDLG